MSKLLKNGTLRRLTAFLLAFCCLFSMAPTAFAADDGDPSTDYREIWVISQPGVPVQITRGPGDEPVVKVADQTYTEGEKRVWNNTKIATINGEQFYVVDPDNMSPDAGSIPGRPEAQNGIGYVRVYTDFDDTILPSSTIPNWEGTTFEYVDGSARPFDRNYITDETEAYQYWAGSVDGGDTFYIGGNKDSWGGMIDEYVDRDTGTPIPNSDGRDRWPSPLSVWFPDAGLVGDQTYYFVQYLVPKSYVDWYVDNMGFMGEGDLSGVSMVNLGNNTMFAYRSTTELPLPELDDVGTVIFDFNLPGEAADVTYLEKGGTMVDVPGISTEEVQGVTFEFKGWFTEPEGGQQITDPQVEVEAGTYTVYYAHWELVVPDIPPEQMGEGDLFVGYFDYNLPGTGVTAVYCAAGTFEWTVTVDGESKTYTAQLPFQFPEDPYRAGYEFLGWATTPDATTPNVNESWLPTREDNTVFGVWRELEYTLTWDANGGQTTTTTTQKYNEEIQPPATEPTREGYTFGGWYLDANCTTPLASGSKVYGDQTFYAKWTSEPVKVNYYDTRQGTSLITTQDYNYGDNLNLLGPLEDTDGWHFVRWETADGQEASTIGELDSSVLTYHKGGNGSDVSSDAGYWVLDIYAVWEQKTTDFVATVRWDDFQDNDGCRPQSVRLGLVSSINDELVAEATVQNDGNDTQTHTFNDLPITTSDTSTEKITYKLIFLGWTDSDGVYRDIHDTAASSGEIEGSSSSDYDDTVSTIYKYAINNYVTGYAGYIKLDHNLITTGDGRLSNYIRCAAHLAKGCFFMSKN